jgi:hypothetical protein
MEIGFDSHNVIEDIYLMGKGIGVLGPMQILYFAEKYNDSIKNIHKFSKHALYGFPLVKVMFKCTRLAFSKIENEKINGFCNIEGSVMKTLNLLFTLYFVNWFENYCGVV